MSGIAEAIVSPLATTLGNVGLTALGRHWANEDWKEQQSILNAQAAHNQVAAPSRIVEGLERAGLNPALASTGTFQPASTPLAPKSQYNMQASPLELANTKLVVAEARKTEADANAQELENKRREDEDATHAENFKQFFETKTNTRISDIQKANPNVSKFQLDNLIDNDPLVNFYKKMAEKDATAGSSRAYRDFVALADEDARLAVNLIEYALRAKVAHGQLSTKDVLDSLINDPKMSYDEKQKHAALMVAQALGAQVSAEATYHNDLAAMLKNRDKLGSMVYLGKEAIDFIEGLSPLAILKFMRGGKKVAPTTEKAFKNMPNVPAGATRIPSKKALERLNKKYPNITL